MHLVYMDDSGDSDLSIFSALAIPVSDWHQSFVQIRDFRRNLKALHGVYVYKELHAWQFVSGRGRPSPNVVTKFQRGAIFAAALNLVAGLPNARLFNAVFPRQADKFAFERLLNRINRTLAAWDSFGILVSDQGKEAEFTRLVRKMYVYNPVPSKYGQWLGTGQQWKNIPLDRIVEDPFFKASSQSYFIQLVDFCAYALLRRERPLPSKSKYGIDKAFAALKPILVVDANRSDPEGIIRP